MSHGTSVCMRFSPLPCSHVLISCPTYTGCCFKDMHVRCPFVHFVLLTCNHNNDKTENRRAPENSKAEKKTVIDTHRNPLHLLFSVPSLSPLTSVSLCQFVLLYPPPRRAITPVCPRSRLSFSILIQPFVSLCSSVLLAGCRWGKTESHVSQSDVLKCSASHPWAPTPTPTPRMSLLKSQVDQVDSPPSAGLTSNQYESRLIAVKS